MDLHFGVSKISTLKKLTKRRERENAKQVTAIQMQSGPGL